jgi:glycosyltransferase involved in cell wall biosynthesis
MDADGQHDPEELPELVKPILTDEADYVQGSRFLGSYDDAGGPRHVGIKGFTALINLLAGTGITDCANGYRAVRSSGLARMRLREDRFSASEIIIEAAARGLRMREVPVHIRSREVGASRKPHGLGYPIGYCSTVIRVWARTRHG